MVLLSDGEDTSSLVTFEEVLDLAKRSATTIYTIGLQSRETSMSKGFREAEFVLRQLAQETGGRAFFPQRAEDLAGIYGEIADELASQYVLGYASTNPKRDGAWRRRHGADQPSGHGGAHQARLLRAGVVAAPEPSRP